MDSRSWCDKCFIFVTVIAVLGAAPLCRAQSYKVTTFAGGGTGAGKSGPAVSASLAGNDSGLAVDASGNLYIADSGANLVRKVTPSGIISVFAGDITAGQGGYYGDAGPATSAGLNGPAALAVDAAGNLYIADTGNNRVRKVSTSGIISTVAGGGGSTVLGGQAIQTFILEGNGLAIDSAGNLYLSQIVGSGASGQVLKVAPNGVITAFAGNPAVIFSPTKIGDGGPATSAFIAQTGLAVDSSGNLYIADAGDNRIRKVSTTGTISTVAGSNSSNYSGDGGLAISAGLNTPFSVAVDAGGNMYIADKGNYRIRKVTPDGNISTIAGTGVPGNSGDAGPATSATVNSLNAIAVGPAGEIYFTDVRVSDGAGLVRVLTPAGSPPVISAGGIVALDSTSNTVAPGEWASIFGSNLATTTASWKGDFPISLGGATVTIDNQPAYLYYASSNQINFQVPNDAKTGIVNVVVTTSFGSATGTVTLSEFSPSFSLLDATHVAGIILRSDGSGAYGGGTYDIIGPTGTSLGYKTVAGKAGDIVVLFGVGFGPTSPNVLAGQAYSGSAPTTNSVQLFIDNIAVTPAFAGITSAGLYQFNIVTLPAGLGTGDVALQAAVGGVRTGSNVVISLQ